VYTASWNRKIEVLDGTTGEQVAELRKSQFTVNCCLRLFRRSFRCAKYP
jgi:hypothetical protein